MGIVSVFLSLLSEYIFVSAFHSFDESGRTNDGKDVTSASDIHRWTSWGDCIRDRRFYSFASIDGMVGSGNNGSELEINKLFGAESWPVDSVDDCVHHDKEDKQDAEDNPLTGKPYIEGHIFADEKHIHCEQQ